MSLHQRLEPFSVNIRPRHASRIKQRLPHVTGKGIPIPSPKMKNLMPSEEETFKANRREEVVYSGDPLRHAQVISILRLEEKLKESPYNRPGEKLAISP